MKETVIASNEAGQRLDKFLFKYMSLAPKSFVYKMLRKKNITLNGHRAEGRELLQENDRVRLFLSDETIANFSGAREEIRYGGADLDILFENDDILLLNKPAGMLTQKSDSKEDSASEYLVDYLLKSGQLTAEDLRTFRPSPCNRLDRNTSGIVLCGKTLPGLQFLSEKIRGHEIGKYYLVPVIGHVDREATVSLYFRKDAARNRVTLFDRQVKDSEEMRTSFQVLAAGDDFSLLKVKLLTGKPHQIRATMAYLQHPVIGDAKYGDEESNRFFRREFNLDHQLLHAWKVRFPETQGKWEALSGELFSSPVPADFLKIIHAIGLGGPND